VSLLLNGVDEVELERHIVLIVSSMPMKRHLTFPC